MKTAWSETGATWWYSDGSTIWVNNNGGFGPSDCDYDPVGTITVSSAPAYGTQLTIPLNKTIITNIINGTLTNNGFLLMGTEPGNSLIRFASSAFSTAEYRPKIVIEYTLPTPTATIQPGWKAKSYAYGDSTHKHAVTGVILTDSANNQSTNSYRYDANGSDLCAPE